MAFPLFCSRSGQMMLRNEPCIFCLSRQFRRFIHHEAGRTSFFSQDRARYPPKVVQSGRSYSSKVIQKTPQQVRTELDDRNSSGFYALARSEGLIAMDPSVAKQIIIDFRDSNINVTQLTQSQCENAIPANLIMLTPSRIRASTLGSYQPRHCDL